MPRYRLLLIAALAGGLAACGGKVDAGGQPGTAEEQEAVGGVLTQEEADAAAAEEINADNLDQKLQEYEQEG